MPMPRTSHARKQSHCRFPRTAFEHTGVSSGIFTPGCAGLSEPRSLEAVERVDSADMTGLTREPSDMEE